MSINLKKIIRLAEAVERIPGGASLLIGGFLGIGSPHRLIGELVRQGRRNLTVIANDTARPGLGIGRLIDAKAVKRLIVSHIGTNPETQRQMIAGETEVTLCPQGTLAERIRAGGYGLGGVLTATGVGTVLAATARQIEIEGKMFLLELPLAADFALIAAHRADYLGNLDYALTARNFNPIMAMAGVVVIAEAAEIVPVGVIPPDEVVTPCILVDYLVAREQVNGR
ncbi:MAG: 3-oxoacid CoA-transferase subunit A [Magnetococcales bacterium]|nr:3-oxoacid CoA-transferase subunit A [Magnetococcales bacterium]